MNGVLPDSDIRRLIDEGAISAETAIIPEQIQPASLDLRLGTTAYRLRASFPYRAFAEDAADTRAA